MQPTGPADSAPDAPGFSPTRPATVLLREFIELSEEFERSIAAELDVNATDLQAMEHLIMAGPLGPTELARRVGISAGAATTSIDRLVALGHLTRQPPPTPPSGTPGVPPSAPRVPAKGLLTVLFTGV